MSLSAAERLRRFYSQFAGDDRVLIAINADPDAIASAMAVKRLLWRKTAGVIVAHANVITRPDNVSMIRLLGVKLRPLTDLPDRPPTRVVMVDSQPDHHPALASLTPQVIIDHHPEGRWPAPFQDIRPHYGATASVVTEYLRAARIKPSARLATALYLGIKTDTSNFERQTVAEDLRAFQFLFRHANVALARKIEQSDLRLDFLRYFRTALERMRLRRSRAFVFLGPVVTPDVCVLLADFFMRVNPITWSVVAGVCGSSLVVILRNDGLRQDAGKLAQRRFGGLGSAGGHRSMARAEIPLERLPDTSSVDDERQVLQWLIERIEC